MQRRDDVDNDNEKPDPDVRSRRRRPKVQRARRPWEVGSPKPPPFNPR